MPTLIAGLEPQKVLRAQDYWKNNPEEFSKEFFGTRLWQGQKDILDAIIKHKRVAVKSGNTIGKSRISAEIILWFLLTYYPSKVVTTSSSWNQVQNILWKELASLYHNSKIVIGGELNQTELKLNDNWFAIGISTDEVNRMQGFHSPNLLVVIDEALGVSPEIWEAIEGLHPSKILALGNPLAPEGNFYNCFSSPLWHKMTISCLDCVRWQLENEKIKGLVTLDWIEERKEDWGEKSPLYQARVLGEFPQEGTDTLIYLKWVEKAREIEIDESPNAKKIQAVDVATKHGSNETVFVFRTGHTIDEIKAYQQIPVTSITGIMKRAYLEKELDVNVIDEDGVGEGCGDILKENHVPYLSFRGGRGQEAYDNLKFKNLRTQFYWIVAKKFEKGLYSLKKLPQKEYDKLKNQLCSIKMKAPDAQGRFQIETKEDMLARQIQSPDFADSFMMSEFGSYCDTLAEVKEYAYR